MLDEAFLSQKFRRNCGQEIQEHCVGRKTKCVISCFFKEYCRLKDKFVSHRSGVVQCLADLMLRDVLKKQNQITEACRDELKFELLQRVCRILLVLL